MRQLLQIADLHRFSGTPQILANDYPRVDVLLAPLRHADGQRQFRRCGNNTGTFGTGPGPGSALLCRRHQRGRDSSPGNFLIKIVFFTTFFHQ